MLKVVSGIVAFLLTFGFSVSLVGLLFGFSSFATPSLSATGDHGTKHKAARFLQRDVRNGRMRDLEVRREVFRTRGIQTNGYRELLPFYSKTVSEYVAESSSMDDSVLPADLRYAWRDHMKAWRKHSEFLKYASTGKFEEQKFNSAYKRSSEEISETWFQVLRIAERYGINTAGMR